MSWGYGRDFVRINGGSYRGAAWSGSARDTSKGMTGSFTGSSYRHPVRVGSVDSDVQELIDEGILEWDMIYDRLYNDFKIKLDSYLDIYYFKYPKAIISQFKEKSDMAKKWVTLSEEEREKEKAFSFFNFQLLISEIKKTDKFIDSFQLEDQLQSLCEKIIKKNNELEIKIGSINTLFNNLYEEIIYIKEKRNYLLLLEFVHSIDNKIITWIKS
jgi:hypothetical protein